MEGRRGEGGNILSSSAGFAGGRRTIRTFLESRLHPFHNLRDTLLPVFAGAARLAGHI